MRHLTEDVDGGRDANRMLICDRDRKWSFRVERFLATAGIRMIRTPFRAPNCKAYASYCTAFVGSETSVRDRRSISGRPCILAGGFSPGGS
jgi:hypothetical protein